jgi:hypothetical protein
VALTCRRCIVNGAASHNALPKLAAVSCNDLVTALSVLTRSPAGRRNFDGAATSQRTPAARTARARPNPVGPASYTTATGPGSCESQPSTSPCAGHSRLRSNTRHRVDTARHHRAGVHIQPHGRTLTEHRDLPANVGTTGQAPPDRQPTTTCKRRSRPHEPSGPTYRLNALVPPPRHPSPCRSASCIRVYASTRQAQVSPAATPASRRGRCRGDRSAARSAAPTVRSRSARSAAPRTGWAASNGFSNGHRPGRGVRGDLRAAAQRVLRAGCGRRC